MGERVTITIDGKEYQVPAGITLTRAAEMVGIDIPIFCDHPRLEPVGACRQCLVEIETPRGTRLTTACTTPVSDGLVVHYNSPRAKAAREATLEFILAHHPLDCPICDKGGECPLQDQAMKHGPAESHFIEEKTHKNKRHPLSDLIMLDQERCVVCWRCIRYLEEWEFKPQLGLYHRGGETVIDTHPNRPLAAKTSGNIIDICPVGALTNRVARFQYRPWSWGPPSRTLEPVPTVCVHCSLGCNLQVDVRTHRVRRIKARENSAVNDMWICDKGRFAQGFFHSEERIRQPLVRENGELRPATWDEALQRVVDGLYRWAQENPEAVGAMGSPKVGNEANYLLQKFFRLMVDTNNIDHRWGGDVLADPRGLSAVEAIHQADVIVLLGVDLAEEMPVFANFYKRAVRRNNAQAFVIHPRRTEDADFGTYIPVLPGSEALLLNALMALMVDQEPFAAQTRRLPGGRDFVTWVKEHRPEDISALVGVSQETLEALARTLAEAQRPLVLYGPDVVRGFQAEANRAALDNLELLLGKDRVAYIAPDANSVGARDMGVLPHRLPGHQDVTDAEVRERFRRYWGSEVPEEAGLTYQGMLEAAANGRLKALFVMGADPADEGPWAEEALKALDVLVVQDVFMTRTALLADVVLPASTYAESDATFTNVERRVQRAPRAFRPERDSRPDWAILVDLAKRWPIREAGESKRKGRKGKRARRSPQARWNYTRPQDVLREIARVVPQYEGLTWDALGEGGRQWPTDRVARPRRFVQVTPRFQAADPEYPYYLVAERFLFDHTKMTRTTEELHHVLEPAVVRMHPEDIYDLGIQEGSTVEVVSRHASVALPVQADERVQRGTVAIAYSLPGSPAEALMGPEGPGVMVAVRTTGPAPRVVNILD